MSLLSDESMLCPSEVLTKHPGEREELPGGWALFPTPVRTPRPPPGCSGSVSPARRLSAMELTRPIPGLREAAMSKKIETVLIGTSLTEASDQVVRAGLKVARAAGGRVVL